MKRTLTTHWRNSKAQRDDAVHFPPQTDQRRLCCTVVNPNNHLLTSPLVYLHHPSAYHRQKASFSATLSFYLDASRPPTTHLLAHSSLSQVSMPFAPGLKDKDPSEITNSSIAFIFAELLSPDTTFLYRAVPGLGWAVAISLCFLQYDQFLSVILVVKPCSVFVTV